MTYYNFIITVIMMMLSIAFYTILERKILSYIQLRKGPNKVGFMGILQPFSDAIKLFNKKLTITDNTNFMISNLTPSISLFLSLLIISIIPFYYIPMMDNKQNMMIFFIISSLSVYSILLIGWATNSKYSHLGVIRSLAQMISYEVIFFLIILFISIISSSYYFPNIMYSQHFMWFFFGNFILFLMWMISCLAETNRSPFDFAEGESELVSGFNTEYMGGWFALIFLAEYLNMIILSMFSTMMFFNFLNLFSSYFILPLITMILLWVRGSYPRFRYDMLMYLCWKSILPIILMLSPQALLLYFYAI